MRSFNVVGQQVREVKDDIVEETVVCDHCGYSPEDEEDQDFITEMWVVFDPGGCGSERLERDLCQDCSNEFSEVVNAFFKLPNRADWTLDRMAREAAQDG